MLEDPFARNDVSLRRMRDKIPSGVVQQRAELLHSSPPIGVGKSAAVGLRDWRQQSGVKERSCRHPEAAFGASAHGMIIHHW